MSQLKTSNCKANTIDTSTRKKPEMEELKCPVCNLMFDLELKIPLVLNCGHIVCKECVNKSLNETNKKKIE